MSNPDFIGKGERRAAHILRNLFPKHHVVPQVPLKLLVPYSTGKSLSKEYSQHKFDILVCGQTDSYAVELNLKHGTIARKKMEVYRYCIESERIKLVEIEANECLSLFDEKDGVHTDSWQDWIDVIRALDKAEVPVQ